MDVSAAREPLVVSAWSAVSPFGIGRDAFAAGVRSGAGTARRVAESHGEVPHDHACLVPDFDVRAVLGRKGTRSMDRVSGLAVATARELLAGVGDLGDPTRTGVVLGTSGTAQQMRDFTRDSLLGSRPFHVNPAIVPNGVMNHAASQIAIWHDLRGPNATVATGRTSGLSALAYARGLLRSGRARRVLVGAAEEYSATRAWLEHHRTSERLALGEGCALFLLESGSAARDGARRPLLEVLAVESQVALGDDVGPALRQCLVDALDRAAVRPEEIGVVRHSAAPGDLGRQEVEAVRSLVGAEALTRAPDVACLGETSSVVAAFQLAALLSVAPTRGGVGDVAAITSVTDEGTVACGLFRLVRDRD
ncbi:3-oxoacyl-[acyl-carrier-protein] synthase II [Streptoalloteichus tenebrarius]|uniref:3-oxoacyl-[acyl-carrier-protein] synthase II n=1 Tax=Streptoalloteichus tenebrarius (strain ATCC 17920 / DSM 40477 / JCM 4838 / CBS 697.72 / NBRC 16177 / NCIMB 11028 / NRRL B-12390 / A12253. 1 / ISP 5477) TaxID=1933 RepID=A0ABT1HLX1_STRSD|nr:beta-ketoacyl synthase N-terminal-like domain-containing protein [Streptoalloteichus tenebrarius]MCP2256517.1 3-oxoacyl-[acyl-carrier-protein] synthase II [Streptoalloteichus tenebrarius]BFF04868.1 beta-ketoacyl synthase N-terminal-like domain-containing protein [Streptoalloteichus tenebrarius]